MSSFQITKDYFSGKVSGQGDLNVELSGGSDTGPRSKHSLENTFLQRLKWSLWWQSKICHSYKKNVWLTNWKCSYFQKLLSINYQTQVPDVSHQRELQCDWSRQIDTTKSKSTSWNIFPSYPLCTNTQSVWKHTPQWQASVFPAQRPQRSKKHWRCFNTALQQATLLLSTGNIFHRTGSVTL